MKWCTTIYIILQQWAILYIYLNPSIVIYNIAEQCKFFKLYRILHWRTTFKEIFIILQEWTQWTIYNLKREYVQGVPQNSLRFSISNFSANDALKIFILDFFK